MILEIDVPIALGNDPVENFKLLYNKFEKLQCENASFECINYKISLKRIRGE